MIKRKVISRQLPLLILWLMASFLLWNFVLNLLTEKGLLLAGVEDEDLGDKAQQIHADIEKERIRKEKAREEARATGKRRRGRRKKGYHQEIEDGAFGTAKKDHVDRVQVKPLDELELLGSIDEAGASSESPITPESPTEPVNSTTPTEHVTATTFVTTIEPAQMEIVPS